MDIYVVFVYNPSWSPTAHVPWSPDVQAHAAFSTLTKAQAYIREMLADVDPDRIATLAVPILERDSGSGWTSNN